MKKFKILCGQRKTYDRQTRSVPFSELEDDKIMTTTIEIEAKTKTDAIRIFNRQITDWHFIECAEVVDEDN